jgi:hypothetical protein
MRTRPAGLSAGDLLFELRRAAFMSAFARMTRFLRQAS